MSDKPTATFTVQCWGCGKSVTKPYEGYLDIEIKLLDLTLEGWMKRKFGPGADVWFCGPMCAYHSMPALQAEEWWSKHTIAPAKNQNPFWTILFFALLGAVTFLFGFFLAR